jgi:hypothetical protein
MKMSCLGFISALFFYYLSADLLKFCLILFRQNISEKFCWNEIKQLSGKRNFTDISQYFAKVLFCHEMAKVTFVGLLVLSPRGKGGCQPCCLGPMGWSAHRDWLLMTTFLFRTKRSLLYKHYRAYCMQRLCLESVRCCARKTLLTTGTGRKFQVRFYMLLKILVACGVCLSIIMLIMTSPFQNCNTCTYIYIHIYLYRTGSGEVIKRSAEWWCTRRGGGIFGSVTRERCPGWCW